MKIRFAKFALASVVLSFAGLAAAADPIKIGVNGPFTGGSSSMGVSMRDGVRLAVEEINKSGGVLGRNSPSSNVTMKPKTSAAYKSHRN